MDISKQHLIGDIEYFKEQEEMQILLRDGCREGSGDYNLHQSLSGTYFRAHTAFAALLEKHIAK